MYPLLFKPIYKEMVWGGQKLSKIYGRDVPFGRIGESWDISCRENEMGAAANGEFVGMPFSAITGQIGEERRGQWLGRNFAHAEFPLLVKIIDANDNLSVQVHPSDEQANAAGGGQQGKCEMWRVMEPPECGSLIIGLKDGVTREMLAKAMDENGGQAVEGLLNRLPVKRGDIVYIPAGLAHALTKGAVIAEIQQNSDTTYRMYDYNRLGLDGNPRQLHKEFALNVTDFESRHKKECVLGIKLEGAPLTYYIANPNFCVIGYDLDHASFAEESDPDKFFIFTCVEGACVINSGRFTIPLMTSRSMLIPAALGEYLINAKHCKLLKTFVPDTDRDFYQPLLKAGHTKEEIYNKTSFRA